MCAKFGTIVMANNDLAMGGAGLMKHPIQSNGRVDSRQHAGDQTHGNQTLYHKTT